MGVADNQSYKDQYHFTDDKKNTAKDLPSVEKDPKINSIIKENPYRSNVEIEGDEIVLQPDLTALFTAKGKSHKQGGMDVMLRPNSFIFSAFDKLAIGDKERELFELKDGGKTSDNTPADIVKKNVNPKHYNTLVNILSDPFKDELAKKTASKMLEKYISTLGNIAYIQEEKKGFPTGVPEFAMNTAPVYDPELKNQIMANKQYMKAGGVTSNPYLPKAQMGMKVPKLMLDYYESLLKKHNQISHIDSDEYKKSMAEMSKLDKLFGNYGVQTEWVSPDPDNYKQKFIKHKLTDDEIRTLDNFISWESPDNKITPPVQNPSTAKIAARQDRYIGQRPPYPNTWTNYFDKTQGIQYTAPDWITPKDFYATPGLIEYMKTLDRHKGVDWDMNKADDAVWGWRHKAAMEKFYPNEKPIKTVQPFKAGPIDMSLINSSYPMNPWKSPTLLDAPLKVPEIEGEPQGSKSANWQFTPWQKLSQLHNWGQYVNVKRYMPYRSRYNATYVDPALVNPEQAIGDAKSMQHQQLLSIGALNPILRNAQASSAMGQVINAIPGIRTQYDNQNANILNQTRQYNNQTKNNESLVNMANDQTYYQQAIEGRKNFENMRQFTANNAMNNTLRDVETNQKLAYGLLTQNNPAYDLDWRTGKFTRTNKSIMDVQSSAVNDRYAALLEMVNTISDPVEKAKLLVKLEGLKVFGTARNDNPIAFKKGGKVKNPYK